MILLFFVYSVVIVTMLFLFVGLDFFDHLYKSSSCIIW
jgi:hypothetical protein